ncbi:hypothetical protein Rsub_13251 [Raphidocelis subcapitata]|uniref:Uncharacterized protein n=1 Tax=Raphidocelis subcapitata TaxID=307507 RepID=A0A2V0PL73_9CHLO|nr:hypothetical protein Rsub_13251 [Raphidocelis subcapitata]|eukprot:GBG00555.1 hypothetical protein Rsub_13251 [Raphidocelis subcapitata]
MAGHRSLSLVMRSFEPRQEAGAGAATPHHHPVPTEAELAAGTPPPAEMNPGVPAPARDKNDYTQVMEQAYRVALESSSSAPRGEVGVASGAPPELAAQRRATVARAAGHMRAASMPKWSV